MQPARQCTNVPMCQQAPLASSKSSPNYAETKILEAHLPASKSLQRCRAAHADAVDCSRVIICVLHLVLRLWRAGRGSNEPSWWQHSACDNNCSASVWPGGDQITNAPTATEASEAVATPAYSCWMMAPGAPRDSSWRTTAATGSPPAWHRTCTGPNHHESHT